MAEQQNININNASYQLGRKQIEVLLKDIKENGTIGTNGKRIINGWSKYVLNQVMLWSGTSKKLAGTPETGGTHIFNSFIRQGGWRERNTSQDYDFLGLSKAKFYSEKINVDKMLETEIGFNNFDLQDTEKGVEILTGLLQTSLRDELKIEIEKRTIEVIKKAIRDGVQWVYDGGDGSKKALIPTYSIEYGIDATEAELTKTRNALHNIFEVLNRKQRIDNPFLYKPTLDKFMGIITPEFNTALNAIQAYGLTGSSIRRDGFLNNFTTNVIGGNYVITISSELPKYLPLVSIPRPGAFNNLTFLYQALPSSFASRMDFVGKSATEKFFKQELGAMTIQASYFGVRAGLVDAFTSANDGEIKYINAHIKSQDYKGKITIEYTFDSNGTEADQFEFVLESSELDTTSPLALTNIDGTTTTIDVSGLSSGSYCVALYRKDDGLGKQILIRTPYYLVSNKDWVEGKAGSITTNATKEEVKEANLENSKQVQKLEEKNNKQQSFIDKLKDQLEEKEKEIKELLNSSKGNIVVDGVDNKDDNNEDKQDENKDNQ